jgi:hypothetical protein
VFDADAAHVVQVEEPEVFAFRQDAGQAARAKQHTVRMLHPEDLAVEEGNVEGLEGSLVEGVLNLFGFHDLSVRIRPGLSVLNKATLADRRCLVNADRQRPTYKARSREICLEARVGFG